jgi:hypothetical protein
MSLDAETNAKLTRIGQQIRANGNSGGAEAEPRGHSGAEAIELAGVGSTDQVDPLR